MRLEYDEIFKNVSHFIAWKIQRRGEELHKEILFASWDSQLEEAEKVRVDVVAVVKITIENINENLHGANLVVESIPGFLPDAKQVEQQWK